MDNTGCWEPITEYVDEQFNSFLEAESRVNRVAIPDNRVHVCLYFLAPTGHGLRAVDADVTGIAFVTRVPEISDE